MPWALPLATAILQKNDYLCNIISEKTFRMNFKKLFFLLGLAVFSLSAAAQRTFDVNLYQGRPRYSNGNVLDTAKARVYLPDEKSNTRRAVVIFPGGGYESLAMDKEGYDWGEFFQNQGIAAIVVKYRMPKGNPDVPVSDAETAMRMVRINAGSWGINDDEVGVMGFSAGGHLASVIATQSTGTAKPNFQILFYPVISMMEGYGHEGSFNNFLGKHPSKRDQKKYSSDQNVSRMTPRALIFLCDDDRVVPPANGASYFMELYRHDVPVYTCISQRRSRLRLKDRIPLSRRDDDGAQVMA